MANTDTRVTTGTALCFPSVQELRKLWTIAL